MAEPVGFEGADLLLNPAEGDEDRVRQLPVFVAPDGLVSCWRLTEDELKEVAKTGVVWLKVCAAPPPPVLLSGMALVEIHKPDGSVRAAKAEPVIPLRKAN